MPKLTGVDWGEVSKGDLIPEGRYPCRIDKVEVKQSKAGNEYWNFHFTITVEPLEGRKVFGIVMPQPNMLWKLKQICDAVGVDLEGRSVEDEFDTDELIGQELGVIVGSDMYEGVLRSRTTGFFAL